MTHIGPLETPPPHPVRAELAERLAERLADHKGSFSKLFTPGTGPMPAHIDALLLPGTLGESLTPADDLKQWLPSLRDEGLVLGWVLGEGSFPELHAACRIAGFAPPPALPAVQDVGGLLRSMGLALPVVDRDLLTLTFPNAERLMHHLKTNGLLQRPPRSGLVTSRRWASLMQALSPQPPRPDDRLPLTLEIIFFTATKPGIGTPQAAKRGSGKISLVKILNPA